MEKRRDSEWCKRCPIEQKILQCMQYGTFVKVYNPDNPRLYTVIAKNSPILDELCTSNPARIPIPDPPEMIGPHSTSTNFGDKKSQSGRSRKRNKKPNKLRQDLWRM